MFNKDLEELKNRYSAMNSIINEIKSTPKGISSRIAEEEQISELEGRMVEMTEAEQNKRKEVKEIRTVSETTRAALSAPTMELQHSREEKKKKGCEKIFQKIIVENFPNTEKIIATQIEEAQRVPYRINPRKNTPDTY